MSSRSSVVLVALLALAIGCGRGSAQPLPPAPPTKRSVVNGLVQLEAKSAHVRLGVLYRFKLRIRCGVELVSDFDGSFWNPIGANAFGGLPQSTDQGTMKLLSADSAEFRSSFGKVIRFRRPHPPGSVVRLGDAHPSSSGKVLEPCHYLKARELPAPPPNRRYSEELPGQLFKIWPNSARIRPGVAYRFELVAGCGVARAIIDFDGSLWDFSGFGRKVDGRQSGYGTTERESYYHGTMTLVSSDVAEFRYARQRVVRSKRHSGTKVVPDCS